MTPTDHQPTKSKVFLQLVSLLIALLMWMRLSGNETQQVRVYSNINLIFDDIPESMRLVAPNYQCRVTLQGSQRDIEDIHPEAILVRLNLGGFQPGKFTLGLAPADVKLSPPNSSVEVLDVNPSSVDMELIHVTIKSLRLVVFPVGDPAANFEIKEMILTPPEITIEGPTEKVEGMELLVADPVNIEGFRQSKQGRLTLNFGRDIPPGTVIREDLQTLRYTVVIEEITKTRKFKRSFPIQFAEEQGYKAKPEMVKLEISGPITVVQWFDPEWVLAEVIVAQEISEDPISTPQDPDDQPSEPGANPDVNGPPAGVPISPRWVLPEEVKQQDPDWSTKVQRLSLRWFPPQVEVQRP